MVVVVIVVICFYLHPIELPTTENATKDDLTKGRLVQEKRG